MRYEDFADLHVAEIMTRWPGTIGVFIDLRMHCIGCPIGAFHTLVDAAEEHAIPLDHLTSAIGAAIEGTGPGGGHSSSRQSATGEAERTRRAAGRRFRHAPFARR